MLISAQAASTSLTSYFTFKEQLKPGKRSNSNPLGALSFQNLNSYSKRYRMKGMIAAAASHNAGFGRETRGGSKRRTLSQEETKEVVKSQRQRSQRVIEIKEEIMVDCKGGESPVKQRDMSEPPSIKEIALLRYNESKESFERTRHGVAERKEMGDSQKKTTIIVRESMFQTMKNEDSQKVIKPARTQLQTLALLRSTGTRKQDPGACGTLPSMRSQTGIISNRPFQETNQDLGILSLCDQSDNKSQTNTSEQQLREENVLLRMEVLKLKKALFMKSHAQQYRIRAAATSEDERDVSILSTNYQEPPEDFLGYRDILINYNTPLTRIQHQNIHEELDDYDHRNSSPKEMHSHRFKEPPKFQETQTRQQQPKYQGAVTAYGGSNGNLTFNHQELLCRQHMSTVDELRGEETEYDDLEKFIKEQGLLGNSKNNCLNECMATYKFYDDTPLGEKQGVMSSVFEQKRHYEEEIETLKRDLEAIEREEQKIKAKIEEKALLAEHQDQRAQILTQKFMNEGRKGMEQQKDLRLNQQLEVNVSFLNIEQNRSKGLIQNYSNVSDEVPQPRTHSYEPIQEPVSVNQVYGWQPPSFCNSQKQSLKASPEHPQIQTYTSSSVINSQSNPSQQSQFLLDEATFNKPKRRYRRSRHGLKNPPHGQTLSQNDNTLLNHRNQERVEGSGRLNTELIDQMFEDPNLQSQFTCLDQAEPAMINLLCGTGSDQNGVKVELLPQTQEAEDPDFPRFQNSQSSYTALQTIKETLKGVLQSNSLPGQASQNHKRYYICDGSRQAKEQTHHKKLSNSSGLARLSTIKEDSPELPCQPYQDSVYMPSTQIHSIDHHHSKHSSFQHFNNGKKPSKCHNNFKFSLNLDYLNQDLKGNNNKSYQIFDYDTTAQNQRASNGGQLPHSIKSKKKKLSGSIPPPPLQRKSSPYSTHQVAAQKPCQSLNQVSNIVNKAYQDIIKRKQREIVNLSQHYITSQYNTSSISQKRKKSKHKESIISTHKESKASQGNKIGFNVGKSSSQLSRNSIIQYRGKENQTSHLINNLQTSYQTALNKSTISRKSKGRSASRSNDAKMVKKDEQQYHLLWNKQRLQKREQIIKEKESMQRQKLDEKMAKIENIQKRKTLEHQERKNKSKSPSTILTTMSELECTPHGLFQTPFERIQGFQTIPVLSTQNPASTARSFRQPGTPQNVDYLKTQVQPQAYRQAYPMTTNQSLNASRVLHTITQQVSAENSINRGIKLSRTPQSLSQTPLGTNRQSMYLGKEICINASSYLSQKNDKPFTVNYGGPSQHARVLSLSSSSSAQTPIVKAKYQIQSQCSLLLSSSNQSLRNSRSSSGVPKINTEKRVVRSPQATSAAGQNQKPKINETMKQFLSQQNTNSELHSEVSHQTREAECQGNFKQFVRK